MAHPAAWSCSRTENGELKTIDFRAEVAQHVERYGSDFSMSRLVHTDHLHVGCMRFESGGSVGCHRAATHQLFAVVEGEGWVRGDGPERVPIKAGEAVFCESGEEHEAGTDFGMVAIVIEGDIV
jgi:quercetin dioxygenase-like cupin family protein